MHSVFRLDELDWTDRGDGSGRALATISDRLQHTRAKFWRYPPGTRGKRHAEREQEELFVVLRGTATMQLGDPPEAVELAPGSVCAVQPGTPLQVQNRGDEEIVLFIVGAPALDGGADYLPDLE